MRAICGLALLLFLAGWWLCQVGPHADVRQPAVEPPRWRRTIDGWQRLPTTPPHPRSGIEALHPALVALGLAQLALLGLVASSRYPARGSDC